MFCDGKATYKIISVALFRFFHFTSWLFKFSFIQIYKAEGNLRIVWIATKVNLLTSSSPCESTPFFDLERLLRRPEMVKYKTSMYVQCGFRIETYSQLSVKFTLQVKFFLS